MAVFAGRFSALEPATGVKDRQGPWVLFTGFFDAVHYGLVHPTLEYEPKRLGSNYTSAVLPSVFVGRAPLTDSGANGGQAGGGYIKTLGQLWPPAVAELIQLSEAL